MTRSPFKATALLLLALLMAGASWAQDLRPTETLYFTPRVGISSYLGDNDPDVDFDEWQAIDGVIPLYGGLEIGYQYTKSFALGFGIGATALPTSLGPDFTDPSDGRTYLKDETQGAYLKYPFYLVARFQGKNNISPYFEIGAGGAISTMNEIGNDGKTTVAYGPQAGLGVDFFFNPRTAFTIGLQTLATFPDDAIDSDELTRSQYGAAVRRFASFDLVNNLSIGLKFNNKKAFTPVDVLSIDGPSTLQVGQSGTYEAMVNMDATQPVEYRWDFGDGNMGTGLVATRSYDRAGTYTVTFTASNGRSMDSESMTTTVVAPPVAASVVSINSTPNPSTTGQTVRFSSNVRGDTPLDYMWNFGDGTTGTGANPTHVYSQPGTYTVSLTVRNNAGSDTATLTQVVNAAMMANPCADIAELNSAYFMNNSSVLTAEARAELMENVEVLRDCACIMTRIEGFAGPRERNPQSLSEARANAVMQFYVDNGISASQLSMSGMGRVGATTTKKDDTSQFRRVDSIPMTSDCNSTMDN